MELTNKQIAFYKGYILPSILDFYKDVDCLEKFKSIEGIDTYFKSFIEVDSLVRFTQKNFSDMMVIVYEFADSNGITDKNGEPLHCMKDYDKEDYFKIKY